MIYLMEYSHDLNYKRNTMNDLVNPTGKWIYLSTETDVSGYKIFEIINHCCGTHLKGWMKAWYQINDEWAMWFPKITTTGKTKSHSSYGGDFWINNLSSDGKTLVQENPNEPPAPIIEDNYYKSHRLVFGRID